MTHKYTLSHKNFVKIHCFRRTLKGILPHDTLSHKFLINCNTLSHNFYQKRIPCHIIFTVKGHHFARHIPSSQIWEYPTPRACRAFQPLTKFTLFVIGEEHKGMLLQSYRTFMIKCFQTGGTCLLMTLKTAMH